jgi:hypothetical protein
MQMIRLVHVSKILYLLMATEKKNSGVFWGKEAWR